MKAIVSRHLVLFTFVTGCTIADSNPPDCVSSGACIDLPGPAPAVEVCGAGADGSCVDETLIAFVDPEGSPSSECSRESPCSLARGLALARDVLELAPGIYTSDEALVVTGTRRVAGTRGTRPRITRATPGPVFVVGRDGDTSFESIEVFGATGTAGDGIGILCPSGPRSLHLSDVLVRGNADSGVEADGCSVVAIGTEAADNGGHGLAVVGATAVVDRSAFVANTGDGVNVGGGRLWLTNSFVVRNGHWGVATAVPAGEGDTRIVFNTIVDNTIGLVGTTFDTSIEAANNIIARNGRPVACPACELGGSMIAHDIAPFRFKAADTKPFDYHLMFGSAAIDAANPAVRIDHDVDGDPRPAGAPRDVGADEAR